MLLVQLNPKSILMNSAPWRAFSLFGSENGFTIGASLGVRARRHKAARSA
jgi:hypothetical protein